jgi:hypothetical protein
LCLVIRTSRKISAAIDSSNRNGATGMVPGTMVIGTALKI